MKTPRKNQTDGVEDIDSEDKLGQPMVNLTLERDWGALDLYVRLRSRVQEAEVVVRATRNRACIPCSGPH